MEKIYIWDSKTKVSYKTTNNGMINKLMETNQTTESYIYNYSKHRDSQIYTAKNITKYFVNISYAC